MQLDLRHPGSFLPTDDGQSFVPRHFGATTELDDLPGYTVELQIVVGDRLQPTCTALTVSGGDRPITGETLRRIPVGRLLRDALAEAARTFKLEERLPGGGARFEMFPDGEAAQQIAKGMRRSRRGLPVTDDDLRGVADIYRRAIADGDRSPTRAVGEAKHVARSTAARWVGKARQKGFLGPASPGRAGEQKEEP